VATLLAHARRFGGAPASLGDELEQRLGVARLASARAGELSRGEKRRVALFAALATARPVIVLDEPLGAFDPRQMIDVLDVLRGRARGGAALLVSVHQMSDAEKLADKLLLVDEGRLLAAGTFDELAARAGARSLEAVFLALLEAHAPS
jgi:ABC-2 type transport system ATP-binding protein